jgi:hypothetical protein
MTTRWSFNIEGISTPNAIWELALQDAKENPPTYVLIMDNKDRARQWQQAVPDCQVIFRTYDSGDNYYHHKVSPLAAAQRLERDHSDMRDVWHYYRLNEPGGEWNRYQDWIIRFAQEAKQRGFQVTAGGLALGKNWKSPDDIENGQADALLDYAIANEDSFLFDAHEYVTGALWAPQLLNYPAALFDRDLLLANENIPVKVDSYIGHLGVNWGLFRVCWLANARALQRHGRVLNVVIDEGLFDFNDHIIRDPHTFSIMPDGSTVKTEDEVRKFKLDPYDALRGVLGHRLYLSWLFTGKMQAVGDAEYCDLVLRNFQWAERSYPENVKAIILFAINPRWRQPQGHDHIPLIEILLPKMRVLSFGAAPTPQPIPTPEPTPVPVPEPTPEPTPALVTRWIRSTNAGGTNIRNTPAINASITGLLQSTWVQAQVGIAPIAAADYGGSDQWYEVDIGGVHGYVAAAYIEIQDVSPPPDEIVLSITIHPENVDTALALLESLVEQLKLAKQGKLATQIATQIYRSA